MAQDTEGEQPEGEAETRRIRVVIQSDEPILAKGLQELLEGDADIQVIASCSSTGELQTLMANERPDIAVVDMTPAVTSATLFALQSAALDCKIILWADRPANPHDGRASSPLNE